MFKKLRLLRDQDGQVFIYVVAVMMLVALVVPSVLSLTSASGQSTQIQTDKMQRYYAADIGIEEILSSGSTVIIEWAERIRDLLDNSTVWVHLDVAGEQERHIRVSRP